MQNVSLLSSLLFCVIGAAWAALYAWAPVRRIVSVQAWGWMLAVWSGLAAASLFYIGWGPVGLMQSDGSVLRSSWPWAPGMGMAFTIHIDGLSLLMGLLVTGIGALVFGYAGHYMAAKEGVWRFFLYLALFQVSMLGLVLAGDLLMLFVFWELTTITSYLLIAYDTRDAAARRGAFKAMAVTAGGGVALLLGFIILSMIAGSSDLAAVLASGEAVRGHGLYGAALALVAIGAFTKSAQVPFYSWLPDGMTAPTPASAYLHSATMVKAGVYLLARLNPAMGFTESWFYLLTGVGMATMLLGAIIGLRSTDLKALLAASTISQLGALTMLAGQSTPGAYKALAVGLLAHGLYKSALFMVAGIVDHEAGTRDLRLLGGLARSMPATLAIGTVAGLSMAGLPPLFGYLAKDALIASATHASLPTPVAWIMAAAVVLSGACIAAQAGILVWGTFIAPPRGPRPHGHDPSWGMLLGPGVPAALSIAVALLALPAASQFASAAASAAYGAPVGAALTLWKGLDVNKALGLLAMGGGLAVFLGRRIVSRGIPKGREVLLPGLLGAMDGAALRTVRTQTGMLHTYLLVIFCAGAAAVVWHGLPSAPSLSALRWDEPWPALRIAGCVLAGAAALAMVFMKKDIHAILALGATGLGVSLLFLVQPAPDVALVMIVADVLTIVILILALQRIPAVCRLEADRLDYAESRSAYRRDGMIAVAAGLLFAFIALVVLIDRPRDSVTAEWYALNAKAAAGASDVVGAILIDFRALDTLIEIAVFALAGVGVYTLMRYASPAAGDADTPSPGEATTDLLHTELVRLLAKGILPLAITVAATHVIYGHAQPGDGFTAGVILTLAVAFRHVAFGWERSRRSKAWMRPMPLVALGLSLAFASASISYIRTGSFFGYVDYGAAIGLPLPMDAALSSSFIFELSIALAVLGGGTLVIDTLSRPRDAIAAEGRPKTWNS